MNSRSTPPHFNSSELKVALMRTPPPSPNALPFHRQVKPTKQTGIHRVGRPSRVCAHWFTIIYYSSSQFVFIFVLILVFITYFIFSWLMLMPYIYHPSRIIYYSSTHFVLFHHHYYLLLIITVFVLLFFLLPHTSLLMADANAMYHPSFIIYYSSTHYLFTYYFLINPFFFSTLDG